MLFELLISLVVGILAGTFTGLTPAIHINLVASLLVSSLGLFAGVPILALVTFIVAMSITHTFIDFIPSVFLGAPEEDSFLAILPGHELLKQGRGYEAIILTLYGSLFSLLVILIFTPVFIYALPIFYNAIKTIIPYILLFVSFYLIFREKNPISSAVIFTMSGLLGYLAFNLPVKEPLMPMLTGLFGLSTLIISIKSKTKIPKQKITKLNKIRLTKKEFLSSGLSALIAAPLCSFLPGIGSGHAAVIGSEIKQQSKRGFLFLVGAINTVVMGLSFVTAYSINKTRTGSATAILELLKTITLENLLVIMSTVIISSIIAFFVGVFFSKIFARHINKIPYSKLNLYVIAILLIFNMILTNYLGILILITASAIGTFCILSNSRRINLMGSLIIPSILYYIF